jgi:HAD superfamily hydrolase (TIGR01484 family)
MPDFSDILLTVDYDRTLTAPDSTVPQRNLEAIQYFMDNGGLFTVNTGRSLPMARPLLERLPFNAPLLLYNGSAAYENGQLINPRPIEMDMGETLRKVAEAFPDLTVELQGVHAHVNFKKDAIWEKFVEKQGADFAYAKFGDDLGPFLKFALAGSPRKKSVATLFESDEGELELFDAAQARILELWGDKVEVYRAAPRIIDVHAKGVSKIAAARQLQQELGKKILVCVGDAENDIPMLEGADYAFCPADGVVANRFETVCNCADGAIADIIYKKIPEILGISLDIMP